MKDLQVYEKRCLKSGHDYQVGGLDTIYCRICGDIIAATYAKGEYIKYSEYMKKRNVNN